MSGTLASLIRQHALNPKVIHQVPETERESAPGRYDQTGSQKSPAIDRQLEKETAKTKGKNEGFDPDDLDDIDDLGDLQDLIDDKKTDPTSGDPGETPTEPLDPNLPDKDDPYADDPDVEVPSPIEKLRAMLLHDGSISYSHNGGASWKEYDSPNDPIGFAVTSEGIYVAQDDAIHYSPNLVDGWTELSVPSTSRPIAGFANGSFEAGITGWDLLSGIEPHATWLEHVIPTDGENYLTRDWLFFTSSGAFEVAQAVELTPTEMAAIGQRYLSFSADVFCESGSVELRIERNVDGMPFFGPADRIYADQVNSGFLHEISMTASDLPDSVTAARIAFDHSITYPLAHNINGPHDIRFYFRIFLRIDDQWKTWAHMGYYAEDVPHGEGIIRLGQFREPYSAVLTSSEYPGTITLQVPVGWKYPIDNYAGGGGPHDRTSSPGYSDTFSDPIGWGTGWVQIASNSGSEFAWNRIAADVYSLPSSEIRCVIKGTGSPADVYIDNARLDLVELPIGVTVTAISKGDDGSAYAAVNGYLHRLHPTGMTRIDNGWTISPTGLNGSAVGWEGSTIETDGGTIEAPGAVRDVLTGPNGLIVTTESGEIYHRTGDIWDNPFGGPIDGQICYEPMRGIFMLFDNAGYLSVSRDGSGWENAWRLPGGYSGEFHTATIGRRVLIWVRDRPMVWWLDSNACRLGGSAPAGILDISGR